MPELQKGDVVRLVEDVLINKTIDGIDITITLGKGDLAFVLDAQGDHVYLDIHSVVEGSHARSIGLQGHVEVPSNAVEALQAVEKPIEEPVDPAPEDPRMSCSKRRFSIATIRDTTKRPECFLYQEALKTIGAYQGNVDGWYGKGSADSTRQFQATNQLGVDGQIGTNTATEIIKQAEAAGFTPNLDLRIMSVIAYYEVGNRRDAFGMAENDIGDGAGANYGIYQCNSLGSVEQMLSRAGETSLLAKYRSTDKSVVNLDVKEWFGSSDGIQQQLKYFKDRILSLAMKQLREFDRFDAWENDPAMQIYWGRAVLLFCDSIVQNGTMWSGGRRPFWKDLVGASRWEASKQVPELYHGDWWNDTLGKYIRYGVDGKSGMKKLWWDHYQQHGGDPDGEHNKTACRAATQSCAKAIVDMIPDDDPSSKMGVLAQFRSRSSWQKYWYRAVGTRRITDAYGASAFHPLGTVNGAKLDLACDYQL